MKSITINHKGEVVEWTEPANYKEDKKGRTDDKEVKLKIKKLKNKKS